MAYDQLGDYDFDLPENLIAQYPLAERSLSRLLCINITKQLIFHQQFTDILSWLEPEDLIVFNDTKVIPARLFGHKASGGKIECLVERILSDHEVLAHIRASKSPAIGSQIYLADAFVATVVSRYQDLYCLQIEGSSSFLSLLEKYGSIPLPRYIRREVDSIDKERYQTVYARECGAVAAPTAGLHFDHKILKALQEKNIYTTSITLHVGAGTFQPVRVQSLLHHQMHSEYMEFSASACDAINKCRKRGGRVVAIGTTVVRCLETVAQRDICRPFSGETNLFIRPGFIFRCVDMLLTNFHLPKTSLLMLVSAFGGYDLVRQAYETAIQNQYRFFSYGDAMLLMRSAHANL